MDDEEWRIAGELAEDLTVACDQHDVDRRYRKAQELYVLLSRLFGPAPIEGTD